MDTTAFRKLRRLAGEAVVRFRMLAENDSVAAALSGGRDSWAMLMILRELQRHAPVRFQLRAVTFDPGFPDFGLEAIQKRCAELGIPHDTVRLDLPKLLEKRPGFRRPCVLCSRLRRGKLYGYARQHGCNKLALGQHADDLLASFLISFVRGRGLSTMGPNIPSDAGTPRVIRPLALAPEALVKAAAAELNLSETGGCPYREELEKSGDRARFGRLIDQLETEYPGCRTAMLHSLSDLRPGYLLDPRYLKFNEER